MGGGAGGSRSHLSFTAQDGRPRLDICRRASGPPPLYSSHSPGAVIVKRVGLNEVKSWFLCFLAEAHRAL